MSDFGPPPGSGEPPARRRPASYLPPGGLAGALSFDQPAYRRYAVTASHKPGIAPLRPLSASDVLDAATALVRRSPGPVLALSAFVNAAAVLPALVVLAGVLTGGWFSRSTLATVVGTDTVVGLLLAGAPLAATAVLTGLLGPLTGEALLGGRPTLGQAWAASRPALPAVLATAAVVLALLVVPWVLVVVAVAVAASAAVPVVLAVGAAGVLAAGAVTLGVLPRVALAGPAVTLERLRPVAGLRRAVALARGRCWSIVGVSALAFGIGVVLFVALLAVGLVAGGLLLDVLELADLDRFLTAASSLVAATLVTPFLAGSVLLQYVDARMRAEGLDLVLRGAPARPEQR